MSDTESSETSSIARELPKVKYDWYQADAYVTVNVLIKNVTENSVNILFEDKCVTINLPTQDSFILNLSKSIVPSKCTHRIKPTKIELKLKKLNEDLWNTLEASKDKKQMEVSLPVAKCNWDKFVESELKDDAAQGEAALNELFQKIYSEGSDEVKKAMNKSFLESGGTVLSTNWNEVGEQKVDIKPPDGMEWKKWEEP